MHVFFFCVRLQQFRGGRSDYSVRTDDGESICAYIEEFQKNPEKALYVLARRVGPRCPDYWEGRTSVLITGRVGPVKVSDYWEGGTSQSVLITGRVGPRCPDYWEGGTSQSVLITGRVGPVKVS